MNKELRRIAILVLAMTLTVVFSVPAMAAENTGKDAVSFSDLLNNDSGETVKTKIKGSQKTIRVLKYGTAKPLDKITVNHGFGRDVYLEKLVDGKWQTVRVYKAANGNKKKNINIDFSTQNVNKKMIKWRIRVPETTITTEKKLGGAKVKDKVTYEEAVKTTKTVCGKFMWPLKKYKSVSSPFGTRMCPFHGAEFHPAVDIPAPTGTKVMAAASGKVIAAGRVASFGNRIIISHEKGGKITTMYNHLSKIKVKKGEKVEAGQIIGKVGSTGDSTGSHLDFRIYMNGKAKSPVKYSNR